MIESKGEYPEITSFGLNGASKYMTSKSGQLYKSNETKSDYFGDYVRSYPDLFAAYKKSSGSSIEVWGERHWETFGKYENRSLRGIPNFEVVLDFNKNPKFSKFRSWPALISILFIVLRNSTTSKYGWIEYLRLVL